MQVFKREVLRPLCRYFHNAKVHLAVQNPNDCRRIYVEPLKQRDLITVQGCDAKVFLQGMMTNDMQHLDARGVHGAKCSMYTLFLNRGGRILYDSIVYCAPGKDAYYLECDSEVTSEFLRYLHQFRVRRKVDIELTNDFSLWVAFSPHYNLSLQRLDAESMIVPDPRLPALGARIIAKSSENLDNMLARFEKAHKGTAVPADAKNNYRLNRYIHGVGEGIEELPPSKCFPLEANADYLHGVSFQKGCYVGQELTARTYHTGVVRKRLMPLRLNSPVPTLTEVHTHDGYKVGVLRGIASSHALGLLNVEKVLNTKNLLINGEPCHVIRPSWWPSSAMEQRKSAIERVSG